MPRPRRPRTSRVPLICSAAAPPAPPSRPPWWSPFSFLLDGRRSLKHGTSHLLGRPSSPSVITLPRSSPPASPTRSSASPGDDGPPPEPDTASPAKPTEPSRPRFPSFASWRHWKKLTLDVYLRVTDRPQHTRLRLKQTIALLPVVKLKPVVDVAYRGPGRPPLAMHLDLKLLDCLKYRVRPDGNALLQVRAKAPLADPRFCVDVTYERDLATKLESVKISFRALDVAFLKAPGFGAGIKYPIRFDNGVKSTLRVKKFLVGEKEFRIGDGKQRRSSPRKTHGNPHPQNPRSFGTPVLHTQVGQRRPRFGIEGPIGLDLKLRCLEFR